MFSFVLPVGAGRWVICQRTVASLAALLALSACSRPEAVQEPVRAVKVMTVGNSGLDMGGEFAAEVRARVESRLGFRVAGKISQRQAEMGQRVSAGAPLAQLDAADAQLNVSRIRDSLLLLERRFCVMTLIYQKFGKVISF